MTNFEVRPLAGGHQGLRGLLSRSFGFDWPVGRRDPFHRLFEPDRSLAAYDGDILAGHVGLLSLSLRVPGGEIGAAGITLCAVRPTHRRGGILRRLMSEQFVRLYESGAEPIVLGSPIDSAIYGRYGGAPAGHQIALEVTKGCGTLRPVPRMDDTTIRYADVQKTREECADLHDAVTAGRPGTFRFTEPWRRELETDPTMMVGDWWSPVQCVFAERDGRSTGFAHYRTQPGDDRNGTLDIRRVLATDAASYAALWRFLLEHDLIATVKHDGLPPDDPALVLLTDCAGVTRRVTDGSWVKVLDVGRALAGRTYTAPIDVVFELSDALAPWNAKRWHLAGDENGATCESTSAAPDLLLDARELGAVFLGGTPLLAMGATGLVEERTRGALAAASQAMAHAVLPWRDIVF